MYFTKYPHPANFAFVDAYDEDSGEIHAGGNTFGSSVTGFEGDVYLLRVTHNGLWKGGNKCLQEPVLPSKTQRHRLKAGEGFEVQLLGKDGKPLLRGTFGVCAESWLYRFDVAEDARFYGMGEKFFGEIELSGRRTKFWNTDVWGDFHYAQFIDHPVDPTYVSVPYVAMKLGSEWVGILIHNPYPTFIETPGVDKALSLEDERPPIRQLIVGAENGQPDLYVLYGPTLPELTTKLQKLVGVVPLPPIWVLGYQQSRWGYRGHDDILAVDAEMERHEIPCDGIWMDLEHMRGFRIFNTSKEAFPEGAAATVEALRKNDRKVVPILDPGVKFEPGYDVYDDGHSKGVFCLNKGGSEYVGLVWPGETVFPDFTLEAGREWWTAYAKSWFEEGFSATWVDMNDPSTGASDPTWMLFQNGTETHDAYHNQYALGMQMATWEGFKRARPHERPFMLTRSGFTGTSRFSAVWTGDNASNYFHLRSSIPTAIGMSLSGLPFSGPDLGGFGGDCPEDLMVDWVKADFLFPFFRNHNVKGSRPQEPYAYPAATMQVVRRYIRLRYKLIPYLYNLFIRQEEEGEPILRPLLYDYDEASTEKVWDEFMVGPFILQAPFLESGAKSRDVVLPGSEPWYDARTGEWRLPGNLMIRNRRSETPLFVAAGAIVPMQKGTPIDNRKELRDLNFHLFVPNGWSGETEVMYKADDGISYAYADGERSVLRIHLAAANGHVAITTDHLQHGFGEIKPSFIFHGAPASVVINGEMTKLSDDKAVLTGRALHVRIPAL